MLTDIRKTSIESVKEIKETFWDIDVVAGNVATAEGCEALIEAGADAVKVGIGPWIDLHNARWSRELVSHRSVRDYGVCRGSREGQHSDNRRWRNSILGRHHQGNRSRRHTVMIGGIFAGLAESPGEQIIYQGRTFKTYRGMGSLGSHGERIQRTLSTRGSRKNQKKLVPEGVEGRVPFKGPLGPFVYQLVGGLRAGMGYCGTRTIDELRKDAQFIRVPPASVRESHPHDISITQEAPNYSSE